MAREEEEPYHRRIQAVRQCRLGKTLAQMRARVAHTAAEARRTGSIEGLVHVRHSAAARLAVPKPSRPAMAQASRAARAPSCAEPGERASMAATQGGEVRL